jgi:hypothetical protein
MTFNSKLILAILLGLVLVNSSIISTENANRKANENAADPLERGKGKKYGLTMTFEDFKK